MRVLVDTNVIISAILFPKSLPSDLIKELAINHDIILCTHIIEELHEIFDRKFTNKKQILEEFLAELTYELIYTPSIINKDKYPFIRDENDLPILVSAMNGMCEVIITGDKDFLEMEIENPKIMTARMFMETVN